MTISDINSYISFRANTNLTEYPAAIRLININRWYEKTVTMIFDSIDGFDYDDSNATDYPIAVEGLIAGQQDYVLPTGLMKVKRVEVSYDNGTTWNKAETIDINQIGMATDTTTVRNNFGTSQPFYDLESNAIKLYPIPQVNSTNGLKLWYAREPAEFTQVEVDAGVKQPGFDEAFHIMIPLGVTYDWFTAKKLFNEATIVNNELMEYEQRLRRQFGKKQTDSSYRFNSAFINYN